MLRLRSSVTSSVRPSDGMREMRRNSARSRRRSVPSTWLWYPPLASARLLLARELAAGGSDLHALAVADGHRRHARPQIVGEPLDPLGGGALELAGSDRIVGDQVDLAVELG